MGQDRRCTTRNLEICINEAENPCMAPSSAFIADATPNSYPTPPFPVDSRTNARVIARSEIVLDTKGN